LTRQIQESGHGNKRQRPRASFPQFLQWGFVIHLDAHEHEPDSGFDTAMLGLTASFLCDRVIAAFFSKALSLLFMTFTGSLFQKPSIGSQNR
jgi:hypothetical protein